MRNRHLYLFTTFLLAVFLATGCARQLTKGDTDQLDGVEAKIAKAEQMGAKECAPRELANAKVELDYARHEASEPWEKAQPFITIADKAADVLLAKTKSCWEAKQVKPAPPWVTLSANPDTIEAGKCATLSWSSTSASSASIDQGIGSVDLSGSRQVCPGSTTQYTITAMGEGGTRTTSTTVTVPEMAPVPAPKAEVKFILLEDEHFDFDKSTLTKEGEGILERNIQVMKENPGIKVRIAGYASASGTEDYNQKLSERRAKTVQDYLIKEGGIAPGRLTTIGYGETRPATYEPIPSDINSKAAKSNMRVLFEIIVK
jgi:outer membrane protein OmpA-like peptidoglycan-associated protein